MADREQTRRFPRLRTRCRVLVRDRYGVWEAETEDLGPRGCRIVTPRAQSVGGVVGLTIESAALTEKLEVTGQVVWTVRHGLARAGISFAGATSTPGAAAPAAWCAALAAADRAAAAGGERIALPPPEGLEVRVDGERADDERLVLARRLVARARALLAAGDAAKASVIVRRAVALAPEDPAVLDLVAEALSIPR